ncbi:MFS transporter [Trinickia sp. Y13]|uniref:MFS transporter n=1 Tax=Trinickia sp. Y13 TaxID=2917807 RepID=UPI0024049AA9|nr:MFS transporter [Trinickia sp. Y13]MDG0025804.1 MFS transporter [Trinickia sp. Y13]
MYLHTAKPASGDAIDSPSVSYAYAWIVFALTFGLLLSDYMSRQVLNAVFPLLKATWHLSDTRLGSLSGVVALMVGVLTFPLSVLADRWGRVRSVILMGTLWSIATLACALSRNYDDMLLARAFVGVGEAAYGSVGLAIVLSIFPPSLRATLTGAFMAGGAFGSVFGMSLGGIVAVRLGWRWSFGAMAVFGCILVLAYWLIVTERRISASRASTDGDANLIAQSAARPSFGALLRGLFSTVSVICAYVGSALQLFIMGAVLAWMPSFLHRYYGLAPDRAGVGAAAFLLLGGAGMIVCGIVTDRISQTFAIRKWVSAIAYSLSSFVLLTVGFHLHAGPAQLAVIGAGVFFVAGTSGPAGAMVARLTPEAIHASAFGTLTLVNNLLGLAPGPLVTGMIADRIGLLGALQAIPFAALAATLVFAIGKRYYSSDLARLAKLERAAAARR